MTRTIYMTCFNHETKQATEHSAPSGFNSFNDVIAMMGQPKQHTMALVIYDSMLFSYLPFWLG